MAAWERIERGLRVIEIVALIAVAIVGGWALHVYQNQAAISVINRLDETDEKLTEMQVKDPYLASIYVDLQGSLAPKEEADLYLAMLAGCSLERDHSCTATDGPLPTWRTIPELDCALWRGPNFNTHTKNKLRNGALHTETILYLVARAHERKNDIGRREYSIWAAYVKNIGHHPLFLTAFHYGRLHGYITEEASDEIIKLLESSPRAVRMTKAIYPGYKSVRHSAEQGENSCP